VKTKTHRSNIVLKVHIDVSVLNTKTSPKKCKHESTVLQLFTKCFMRFQILCFTKEDFRNQPKTSFDQGTENKSWCKCTLHISIFI